MTIRIECDKCGESGINICTFKDRSFSYLDKDNYAIDIHLCSNCQLELQDKINGAIADFIGEASIRDWSQGKVIP